MDRAGLQILQFLASIGLGISLGILYDFYRVWFRKGRSKLTMAVGDSIFTFLALIWAFVILLWLNSAELRFYIILAVGIGIAVYLKCLSPVLLPFWQRFFTFWGKIVKFIVKLIKKILLLIAKPIIFLSIIIFRILYFIAQKSGLAGKRVGKGMDFLSKKAKKSSTYLKNKAKKQAGKLRKPKNT